MFRLEVKQTRRVAGEVKRDWAVFAKLLAARPGVPGPFE
jgi:hypothetical protein